MDRKAVSRAYKETRQPMGIYRVRNVQSGQYLVGKSLNLPAILNRHQADLRFGGHRNRALQQDWTASGGDAFAFEVLDTLSPTDAPDYDPADDLRVLEAMWVERLRSEGAEPYPTK